MELSISKLCCLLGVILVIVTGYALYEVSESKPVSMTAVVIRPVNTVMVKTNSMLFERKFPGKVRSGKRVNLAFSVPGVIEYLEASEGARVKKGKKIARLDPRDYRYRLDSAKARHKQLKNELGRLRQLLDKKLISQTNFDQQLADYDMALATLEASQKALADTQIIAPFDGVIAKRYLENGEHIQADQTIISLQDISNIEIVMQVPERFIANKSHLQSADFSVQLNVGNSQWLPARVIEHSIESSLSANTYDVVVAIDALPGISIYPGMTAVVRAAGSLPLSSTTGHVQIPVDSVLLDPAGNSFVWVIPVEGGCPEKRMVTLGDLHADAIIVHSGLNAGELVAISGLHSISVDQPLRPMLMGKEGLAG